MDKEAKEIISELISILLGSCTKQHYNDYEGHEHELFDDSDTRKLEQLRDRLDVLK